jgi:hypothetical protein
LHGPALPAADTTLYPAPVPSVSSFAVGDLEVLSRELREVGAGSDSMESAAQRIVDHVHGVLRSDGEPDCVNVSLHKTHLFRALPARLQKLAVEADGTVEPQTACLARLAVAGYDEPQPEAAALVRPLTAAAFEEQPILVGLLLAMGLDQEAATDPQRAVSVGIHREELEAFFVPDLASSEWVGDQETREQVAALGLASLLGIGGGLPSGDLFFLFLFTRTPITPRSADLMRSLAPALKAALIPHSLRPFAA